MKRQTSHRSSPTPDVLFKRVVASFRSDPNITAPDSSARPRFGANALKIREKMFASLTSDAKLLVKLPRGRVDEIVAGGQGERFDPRGDGRVMKEWVCVPADSKLNWVRLAREARDFLSLTQR
jgi:hypothetical protein